MVDSQVISTIKRRTTGGRWDTYHLGPSLRYTESLPTSNNNNLEEQLLMGVDRIITSLHDAEEDADKKIIEFRRKEDDDEYYILEITSYGGQAGAKYIVDNGILTLYSNAPTSGGSGSGADIYISGTGIHFTRNMSVEDEDLVQDEYDEQFVYSDTLNGFYATPDIVVEIHRLKFKKGANEELISTKTITQIYREGRAITKESIARNI